MKKIKRVWGYFKDYKYQLVLSFIFSLIVAASNGASAYYIKPVIDEIFIKKEKSMIIILVVTIILIYLIKGIARFYQNYLMRTSSQKAIKKIRDELYDKIISLPISFFNETSTGMLMSRVTYDVGLIQSSIPSFIAMIREIFSITGLAFVVLYQDLYFGLIAIFILPFFVLPVVALGKKIKKYSKRGQSTIGDISSLLNETIRGIKVIKSFTNEENEKIRFRQNNEKFLKQDMKATFYNELGSPIMELLGAFVIAVVLIYGGNKVISGESTPGTFFSLMAAIAMMYDPFKRINNSNSTIQAAIGAAERIFELIDKYESYRYTEGTDICEAWGKDIEFKNVNFSYVSSDKTVLKNINLKINPGETFAIVGHSGSGKSTLVSLLPRFYDVTDGEITIGGKNIQSFTIKSLRSQIAFVNQEIFLFNESINFNISYGDDKIDEKKVIEAAKAAYAHDFIMEMPQKYDTKIGELGLKLSGGQRQRLAIARAIYKNPPILILDEATSALDTESEKIVQEALYNLMKGKTSLVIAHRLSTILNADKIVVMNEGSIEAIGKHEELLEISKHYRKLYTMQFGEIN
ncbi:MAG: ATP-binding cassette domain-containing protein [Calditerrivibrio sp.]|nr:ATP-binding cassette domain-containing protein [Calditerrivibrio sp.]MCA1932548.1 ATP-binding cassette domain-containing protein [Calditerrivibrio sp.]MCA1980062.1 ATP-binding cassette domain-containing protein [Calditerrivibrio sp.]